jgi:hypothetical protein
VFVLKLVAFSSVFAAQAMVAEAVEFRYVLTGGTSVYSTENAVKLMTIDMSGEFVIDDAGNISGDGSLTYLYMQKCAWQPPLPVDDHNCQIQGVQDGSFSITGNVIETVHRLDDDNPLKDAIFAFADEKASERPGYAPYRLSLTVSPTGLIAENLALWGFSDGQVQNRSTGAAALGLLVSGVFDTPFELIALNSESEQPVPNDAHRHTFNGVYDQGTWITATGNLMLSSIDRNWLPSATDPAVYVSDWLAPPPDRDFTQAELDIMEDYAENGPLGEIRDEMRDMVIEHFHDLADQDLIPSALNYGVLNAQRKFYGLSPLVPKNGY